MSHVLIDKHNNVLTLSLDRAHKKNALTFDMYEQMAEALSALQSDGEIRVVVIKGVGDCFSAGNDLEDFAQTDAESQLSHVSRFMHALLHCPLPVVAQVHGLALGIGTTMLLHCDMVFCAEGTRFGLPFINLGLVPEFASSYMLPRLVGHRKAAQWLMLGEQIDADEALHFGLVNEVVKQQELENKVNTIATQLARKPQKALSLTKSLMRTNTDDIVLHMNDELDVFSLQLSSGPSREAFSAFLEKREPDPKKFK